MRPSPLALAVPVTLTLALVSACKRDDGQTASTTTVRSGTPAGVRVTNTPDPGEQSGREYAADRISAAICALERRCGAAEDPARSAEAELLDEAVCIAERKARTVRSVESWNCSPALERAGFEECIAAINAEVRCRDVSLGERSVVPECRPSRICHAGEGITQR
ncbi:MAG: hypothetical protein KF850_28100 [Labilithrix sp.]|nr:hypothetical protein [Labilithrix sp.]MBX3215935.1 hypothetical protein [Labilithrix sp.]